MRHVVPQKVDEPNTPLTEPVFLILVSLADSPQHGYSLLKDIEELSGGKIRLSTGTLYGALRRLLDDGWIERFDSGDSSRDKRSYRLTSLGKRVATGEFERLKHMTRIARPRLRVKEA